MHNAQYKPAFSKNPVLWKKNIAPPFGGGAYNSFKKTLFGIWLTEYEERTRRDRFSVRLVLLRFFYFLRIM